MSIIYLNGKYLPAEHAQVSVMDRGFLFGDGVYEVIPVFGAHVLRLSEHIQRLARSLQMTYMPNPHTDLEWVDIVDEILLRNPVAEDRSVYVQVTRGVGERDHIFAADMVPTVLAMCRPIPERDFSAGISTISHEDIRWQYCDIKAISLLPGVLLRHIAHNRDGSLEAILYKDDVVTEGAASNVFIVSEGTVLTPAKDRSLLPGVTRDLIVELLGSTGIPIHETRITTAQLHKADEIWITSSTICIAPVSRIDGKPVGSGAPGPMWRQAYRHYEDFKSAVAGHRSVGMVST